MNRNSTSAPPPRNHNREGGPSSARFCAQRHPLLSCAEQMAVQGAQIVVGCAEQYVELDAATGAPLPSLHNWPVGTAGVAALSNRLIIAEGFGGFPGAGRIDLPNGSFVPAFGGALFVSDAALWR